jgi:hypothetical protein
MFELSMQSILLSSLSMTLAAMLVQAAAAQVCTPHFTPGKTIFFFPIKPRYRRMIGPIFEFADLQRLSGFERRADVERWANENGIPVKACRGGVWTTLAAVNLSLGISASHDSEGAYPPDAV